MGYTKNHEAWANTDPLTAKAFNNFESQYDYILHDILDHNHDTEYYTNSIANDRFFTVNYYETFDADTLDTMHASDLIGASIPIGGIIILYGNDIPSGYGVCDGSLYNNVQSPDLRDRFVIGAGNLYSLGVNGGNANITPTATITIGNHILDITEIPSHRHTYADMWNPAGCNHYGSGWGYATLSAPHAKSALDQSSGDGAHNHTSGSTITFDEIITLPEYMALQYIIRYE